MITFHVKHQNDYQDFNYFAQKFLIKVKSLLRVGIDFTPLWAMNFYTMQLELITLTTESFQTQR